MMWRAMLTGGLLTALPLGGITAQQGWRRTGV
jgi:hypothetical protein